MNSAAFRAFSSLAVPNYRGEAINTMAVNRWGDVFSLSQNGLNYISLLQKTTESNSLPLSGPDKQLLSQMSCLKFNSYGTMLLVWGANAAGIVVLPRTYTLYGEFEFDGSDKRKACEFIAVLRPEECRGQLMKVQWHPFHSEYVVMLHQKGPIEMKNIFTNSKISAFLSQSIQYSSFSFGPCIGWLAVSVLVLADNGYVYVICPMLPVGSLIPTEVVLQMAEGLAYENDVMKQPSSERGRLLRHANLYMSAAFGDLSGEYRAHGNWIRVGGPIASLRASAATAEPTELSYHQRLMLEVLNCPPALQGALHEISDANMPSNASSKRQNVGPGSSKSHTDWSNAGSSDKSSSRKRDSGTNELAATACDIVVLPAAPGERGSESDWSSSDCAPVVVMVRTDGSSKICVIKGQLCPHWDDIATAQSFLLLQEAISCHGSSIGENVLLQPLPDMVVVEIKSSPLLGAKDTFMQLWSLRADPVLRHCFHMIAHSSGAAFIISVRWLADALFSLEAVDGGEFEISGGPYHSRIHDRKSFATQLSPADKSLDITPATVIPVFPTATFRSSVANGHAISAFLVIHDPTYGHMALYQTSSLVDNTPLTSVSTVNLTVLLASIAQEQRLSNKIQRAVYTTGEIMAPSANDNLSIDRDDALHRSASRILKQSEQALQDCRIQVMQHENDRLAKVEPPSVDLSSTWSKLDNEVVVPLEELQQRINLSVDIVRDVYEAQVEMMAGSTSTPGGLISQMESIKTKQAAIDARMKAIAEIIDEQVNACAAIMTFASYKTRELTTGEREYKAELARCETIVTRLDAAIQSLESIQIQRTRISRDSRNVLTPPSGLKNRLEQAGHPGSPVSPSPLALLSRDPSGEDSTAEVQQAFMSLGLKSKKLPIERTSGQLESKSNEQSESSMFRHEPHQSTSFPADIKGSGYYQHNAEFNVYSTHTPFVTPLRPKNNDLSSADKMSFSSPVAPISNGRNGHWTVHNFTSTTPHKTASKWSVNRTSVGAGRPISGQLFRTSHKRRPETETLEQIDQPSRKHSVSIGESGASAQIRHNIQLEEVDRALLEKLGKEGSDIEYLCKEINDVEKRIAELTNVTMMMPSGGLGEQSNIMS